MLSRIPVKTEISKFFIISQKKPFGETFWKITIKQKWPISPACSSMNERFPQAMEDLEALCKKLSFLSTKNQLKWNGSKNDLLRFLALHLGVQPNQFRANDNGTCAVFKIQNITCNFYHKAKTLQNLRKRRRRQTEKRFN